MIGLPGAGKTTMGMELAQQLTRFFVDLDQEIEKDQKQSIVNLFGSTGEAHFRQLEKLHLNKIIREVDEFVMATGGGTPCFFDNMEKMNTTGETIFIDTPIEKIKARLQNDTTRPLMQSNKLEELYENRIDWYRKAKYTVQSLDELLSLF